MRALRFGSIILLGVLAACGDDATVSPDGTATAGCRSDADCDDGAHCNGTERCAAGACEPGTPVDCDDGVDCTTDRCDDALARCVNEPEDADDDGFAAASCGGDDCDDADPERFPGNLEICDDENLDEDCDESTYGFRDADGDGFPDARCCNGEECGTDCDDTLPSAHPGEAESCDGFDNDCDGTVDEGVTEAFYADTDGDRFGDPMGEVQMACFTPDGFAAVDTDCDDSRAEVRPGAPELCDTEVPPVDENCDGVANPDSLCNCSVGESRTCAAGGLFGVCAGGTQSCAMGAWGACSIAPTAELCDGEDDDCDGFVDEGLTIQCWTDADGDTFALAGAAEQFVCPDPTRPAVGECPLGLTDRPPVGTVGGVVQFECDDADPAIRPDQAEVCNGVDDDCDGAVDEMTTVTCYADADGDSYPASGATPTFQCPGLGGGCPNGYTDRTPGAGNNDCDDANVGVSPAVSEVCDGATDEDCDGSIDEMTTVTCYTDGDGDTYSPASATPTVRCADPGTGTCPAGATTRPPSMGLDCDDGASGVNPVAGETCDGVDQDCDGSTDEGTRISCWADGDGDGYAAGGTPRELLCAVAGTCPAGKTPTAPTTPDIDCDEGDAGRSPGDAEVCDGDDEDCDGRVDEGQTIVCYTDADGDDFAAAGTAPMATCPSGGVCPSGTTGTSPGAGADCDDASAARTFETACWEDVDGDGIPRAGATLISYCGDTCGAGLTDVPPSVEDCNDSDPSLAFSLPCFTDADGDGYAAAGATSTAVCALLCPDGSTAIDPAFGPVDCDDANAGRSPVLNEVCDYTTDEDCDGAVDEGLQVDGFQDRDGDSYGSASGRFCPDDPQLVTRGGDCRDDQPDVHPGQLGYFATPACTAGETPCTSGGLPGCGGFDADAGGTYCNTNLRFLWDYDCSGDIDATPPSLIMCPTSVCGGACNGTGGDYLFDPLFQSFCGTSVPNEFCACDTGGGCSRFTNPTVSMVTVQCH